MHGSIDRTDHAGAYQIRLRPIQEETMTLRVKAIWITALAIAGGRLEAAEALLHPLFAEHAVLQRDRPIEVWGQAAPNDQITVTLASARAVGIANASGHWTVALPPLGAGGPYELAARSGSGASQTVSDVQVGDVWLCSGQSNMALTVTRSLGSAAEIASSANDLIRALTIPLAANPLPLESFAAPLEWRVAGPASTGGFSATCYYFARELQKTVHVPMGLVVSAWGGSKIQPWMSAQALRAQGDSDALLSILADYPLDPAKAALRFGAIWQDWWKSRVTNPAQAEPWNPTSVSAAWRDAPSALGFWENWGVPALADYNGIVIYRTRVTVTPQQASLAAVLSIGTVDDIDLTWVNGHVVGSSSGGERRYKLSPGTLRAGENVVVVSDLDTYANGGLYGPAEKRAIVFDDGSSVPLAGPWQYQIAPAGIGQPPRAPWESTAGLTTIYNAMIAPLGTYGFRGALWYQGESNSYLVEADAYERQMAGLMADWRGRFGADLPFLIVQLPNYGTVPTAPVESGWAQVREGQRRAAAADTHAGLAVAIDVGEPYELHPANKQEVGRRLARAARRVVYGEAIKNGPLPSGARRAGASVVVSFQDVDGQLLARSGKSPTAFELCGAASGSCRYVDVKMENEQIVLDATGANDAKRVRYCWADAPVCTLTDRSGLPATPFEIAVQ
jgi:sialate O-acetylesterase